jgi:hypothetical protein
MAFIISYFTPEENINIDIPAIAVLHISVSYAFLWNGAENYVEIATCHRLR